MIDAATMEAVVHRYFEFLDAEDWEAMRELWHEDAQLRAVGARDRNDREDVLGYFSKLFDPWPEHIDRPVRVVVSEAARIVVVEVEFAGVTPHGRRVVFDAVDVFDFAPDGRISKLSNWYDIDVARKSIQPPAADALID
jgi:ketosteroid isomerase-like protein